MNKIPDSLLKNPELKPAEDYYRLRREGIGFIQEMGSRLWTDYNTHDPGITILESLCYAITDLAYRCGWQIVDLLTPAIPPAKPEQPFRDQAFFTARNILTINPATPDDFRRLLIDLEDIRNAWVFCRNCASDVSYYAWCRNDQMQLSYQSPDTALHPVKVEPQGLYEILLELEADSEFGDLNDLKIKHVHNVFDSEGKAHPVTMELRFPAWELANPTQSGLFLESKDAFDGKNGAGFTLKVLRFGATKSFDMLTDSALKNDAERDSYLRSHWRNVLYLSFELELLPGGEKITIENAALRIFGDVFAKNTATVLDMKILFEDPTPAGFIQRYRNKRLTALNAIGDAKDTLQKYRNLDEDYHRVRIINIEDVSVCADIEVRPDADIESVQAEIWLIVERYFNPPVPFYTLQELLAGNTPVEDIFNGPELNNGFIKSEDLQSSDLKTVLRTSDLINSLMDIDGIIAVNNLLLTKYDAEGHVAKGAADPSWSADGRPLFDSNKISASWLLFISNLHQPRFHRELSRFLFFKNGLPFLPRQDEAYETLIQRRGELDRPKIKNTHNDLPIPEGRFRDPEAYFPLQYGFPLTYGIGTEGLPAHASDQRKAQARQLKAYLMIFEQLIANAQAQIAHTADLFSLNPAIDRTYFVRKFNESIITGYSDLLDGLDADALLALAESPPEFHERRNRFLNHLMARFGEQFGEYALLITRSQGREAAQDRLIEDKIAFLNAYPLISHDRGRAFNYKLPFSPDKHSDINQYNISRPGIKKRVSLLLGFPDLKFERIITGPNGGPYAVAYQLNDIRQKSWFTGSLTSAASDAETASQQAFRTVIVQMSRADAYEIAVEGQQFRVKLKDNSNNPLGQSALLDSKNQAEDLQAELLSWSANERSIVVEHLLLRPKFPGDALYPACVSGDCMTCGDEDPYSYRLTWIMPGWTAPYNDNLEMRDFADRTIRKEMPAHLLAKTCWVGNDEFITNPCSPVVSRLAAWLDTHAVTADGVKLDEQQACDCALALYTRFSETFNAWYRDKTLLYFQPDMLKTQLQTLFSGLNADGLACVAAFTANAWQTVQELMLDYFQQIVLNGWQFERFEETWQRWLEANAKMDWMEERLQERLHAILNANLVNTVGGDLCRCSTEILSAYGMTFYQWMSDNIQQGHDLSNLSAFQPTTILLREEGSGQPPTFCIDLTFKTGTSAAVQTLLNDRYSAYRNVSYYLGQLVTLLANLSNTYPDATLHDCDDGSDQNPVRLGSTALGSLHTRRPSETL